MPHDYSELYDRFGDHWKVSQWESQAAQRKRFDILCELFPTDMSSFSVLDAGCGLGDLFVHMRGRFRFTYVGLDIEPKLVQAVREKGLHANVGRIEDFRGDFDYIVCSGAFNITGNIWTGIESMWKSASKGIAFNFLNKDYYARAGKEMQYYDPVLLLAFCIQHLKPAQWRVVAGYIPHDVTILLWK